MIQSFIVKIFPVNTLQLNKSLSASTYGSCASSREGVNESELQVGISLLKYFKPFRVKGAQHTPKDSLPDYSGCLSEDI